MENNNNFNVNKENFQNLDTESKSLLIREFFENATKNAFFYNNAKSLSELEDKLSGKERYLGILIMRNSMNDNTSYTIVSNEQDVIAILNNYNEDLFKTNEADMFIQDSFERCFAMTIEPNTFLRYTSEKNIKTLPHLTEALLQENWRREPNILEYKNKEPLIVLRGIVLTEGKITTPGYFYCDANDVITQQLINYKNTITENSMNLSFPETEGRGACFSCQNVPFHSYNSRSYNDNLCESIGLCENTSDFFRIIKTASIPHEIEIRKLSQEEGYSKIPQISKRQNNSFDYVDVLMAPLSFYIQESLKYQLSLPTTKRIARNDNTFATNEEINNAIGFIQKIKPILTEKYNNEYITTINTIKPKMEPDLIKNKTLL